MSYSRIWDEDGRTYNKFQVDTTREGWPVFCIVERELDKDDKLIVKRRIQVDDFADNHSSLKLEKRAETDTVIKEATRILREFRNEREHKKMSDEQRRQELAEKFGVSIEDVIAAEQVFARSYGRPSEENLALADEIKTKAVELLLLYYKVSPVHLGADGIRVRGANVSHAVRQLEDSVMWAVKALLNSGN